MSRDGRVLRRGRATAGVAAPADRRFRRSDVPPTRRRRLGRTIWTVARVGLIVGVVAGVTAWATDRIAASDVFLVREITVRGTSRLSAGDVEALLAGLREENLFRVDFEQYRRRALDSSWIEHVALSRVLPSTIVVDVVERTPMAIARLGQQLYLIDRTGNIIDEHSAAHRDFDLPIVDGLLTAPRRGEPLADADRVQLTGSLLTALDARPDLRQRLSQIDVSDSRDAVVMFDDDPAWLHLGRAKFAERLQQYVDLTPALRDRFSSIDYVDLKFDERVYVRGQERRSVRPAATR